jgi:hypothetical protein
MKNFSITLILGLSLSAITAQTTWNTTLNSGSTLKLGTSSNNVLDFWTNNTKKMTLGTDGTLKLTTFVKTKRALIYVDETGTFRRAPDGGPGNIDGPCIINSMPWYMGGNINPTDNSAGTCSNQDFILKSNDVKSIFIKPSGFVGIGQTNNSPAAALDVFDGSIPSNTGHIRIFGDQWGTIESTTDLSMYYKTSSNFFIFEGSSLGGTVIQRLTLNSSGLGVTNDISASGKIYNSTSNSAATAFQAYNTTTGKVNYSVLNSGKTVVGWQTSMTNAALVNLNLNSVLAGAGGDNALDVYDQLNSKVNFRVKASGFTQIGSQTGMINAALLNLNLNSTLAGASADNALDVFDQTTNKVNFRVKASGFVYAREVNVLASATNFPDYVFDNDYKLNSLENLEKYIKANKHLPGVPTAKEVEKNGLNIGEISRIQMEKIEELTLYIIELKKEVEALKKNKTN